MPACARCGQHNPEIARFCLACGAPLAHADVRQERKVVSVLFADLVGFTGRAERLDPEDVRAMLQPYHALLKHELERHGGTVEKFIGDAAMALFGAPVAHEDDAERAVRAALAIQAAIAELNEQDADRDLQVRIGITTGEALVTLGARPSEGEGMAAGDVVNTAARLQAAAPANGVLVDEATERATAEAIEYRVHEPITTKGKADPVMVWEAVAARARFGVDVVQDARTPLVGRTRELGVLTDALERARAEQATQLVTLIGVPGIGKSRLVWELFQQVDADPELITWRQGRCLSYGEGVAFWALSEMVKAQVGLLDTDTAAEAEEKLAATVSVLVPEEAEREWVVGHARPLLGLPGESASGMTEAFAAWRRLIEALAELRPLVLVFEDIHWGDEGLLDFVDHLVDWASGAPLLVVCTARPELLERRPSWGGGKLNAATLALSPLDPEDAARLVATLLDQPLLPAALQHTLLERAEGNPLYAEQYVRMLADRGLLVRDRGGWALPEGEQLPLPETLQGIIAARLDELPTEEKLLLQDAAVLGKVFWLGALSLIGDGDREALQVRLHKLERKGFVRRERRSSVAEETEYAFAHALVRDVAYTQIPRIERAEKHERAAQWIEMLAAERSEDRAQVAAHHLVQALELTRAAGRDEPDLATRARRALVDAGDRADRLSATDAARDLYEQALALVPRDDPERPLLLYRFGRAAVYSGVDALAELAEAAEQLRASGDVETSADAVFSRSWYLWNVGRNDEAWQLTEEALALVADRPPSPIKAYIVGMYAVRCTLAGRGKEALEYAQKELELGMELGRDRHRAHALITIGTAQSIAGDYAGVGAIEQGLELARELNDAPVVIRGYKNLASLLAVFAQVHRAAQLTEDALRAAVRFGDGFHVAWFEVELALYAYLDGDWDAASKRLHSFFGGLGMKRHYLEGHAHILRGRLDAERGRLQDGVRDSSLGLDFARSTGEHQLLLPALASHARVLLFAGRDADAGTLVDEFLGIVGQPTIALADVATVLVELDRGADFERIDRAIRSTPWGEPASAFAREDYVRAAQLYGAAGARVYEAEARLGLARRFAAGGAYAEAAREADAAAAFFRRAGATARAADSQAAARASA